MSAVISQWTAQVRAAPPWFVASAGLGLWIRLFLVVFSEGSNDVGLMESHATAVSRYGLIGAYESSALVNHPPPLLFAARGALAIADGVGMPFGVVWRLPFALFDGLTALLLARCLLPGSRRYVLVAVYWLSPVAIILSSFHGNTDTLLAAVVLGCILLTRARRPGLVGALLAIGLWIKLPVVLAAPLVLFAQPKSWRPRLVFATAAVALIGYAPALPDVPLLIERVFGYGGIVIKLPDGNFIWGVQSYYSALTVFPQAWWPSLSHAVSWYYGWNGPVCVALVLAYTALVARNGVDAARLGITELGGLSVFLAASNMFAFQYLGWVAPLWLLMTPRLGIALTWIVGAYLWGAYAWACQSPVLLGSFELIARPFPGWLLGLRNLAFAGIATVAIVSIGRELGQPARK